MSSPGSRDEASGFSWARLAPAEGGFLERLVAGASAAEVAGALALRPHREGGFFRETYRSPLTISTNVGERCLATSILYLLTGGSPSRLHRLRFDEMWFYHAGRPAELVMLTGGEGEGAQAASRPPTGPSPAPGSTQGSGSTPGAGRTQPRAGEGGRMQIHLLGPDQPQVVVPGGWWLGARVAPRGPKGESVGAVAPGRGEATPRDEETEWTLVGCVVTPGFEYEDFEVADPRSLLREFPEAARIIAALT